MEGTRETNQLLVDGKYKIIKKIGSGAFGVIYKGNIKSISNSFSSGLNQERRGRG